MRKMKRKINWTLVFGAVILSIIIIVMLFPRLFTSINPYESQIVSGGGALKSPPFPPSKEYFLGSDILGRDIFSFIIYGTRLTMLLGLFVVVGRFLIAIPLGLCAGFGNKLARTIINQFSIVFSAIPTLIVCIIVLRMPFFSNLYKQESVMAFGLVLIFVGFGKLGRLIEERVVGILNRPFIKGEIAIGKSRLKIAIENVIPHLAGELIVLFFMEFATALSLIMQLGVFYVFVGNLKIMDEDDARKVIQLPLSFEPEWASMLGAARVNIISAPWTIISPAVAFVISIFGLNVFAEGLRKVFHKKDSNFIPRIRRSLSFEKSDVRIKNFNPIMGKFKFVTIIVIGIFIYIIGTNIYDMRYSFNSNRVSYNGNFKEVIVGSKEAENTAMDIAKEFKTDGFKPISKEGYIVPYNLEKEYFCYYGNATFEDNNKTEHLELGKDYAPGSFGNFDFNGEIYDSTGIDFFANEDYTKFNNKIVLLNGNMYSEAAMLDISDNIIKNSSAKGILLLEKDGEKLPNIFGKRVLKYPLMWVTQNALDKVNNSTSKVISMGIRSRSIAGTGHNIIGILPGSDKKLKNKAIMVGFGYNYMSKDREFGAEKIKFGLEMMKKLSGIKRERAVIVSFWDGTLADNNNNGKIYYSKNLIYESADINAYVDLTKLSAKKSSAVYFNSDLSPATRYLAWVMGHKMKNVFKNNTKVLEYTNIRDNEEALQSGPNDDEAMYYNGSMPVIIVANDYDKNIKKSKNNISIDEIGRIVFKAIQENTY